MINSQPLVSVVVITYNSSQYIQETLDSVFSQSYSNIELIIADDFSKDNTINLCREWIDSHQNRFSDIKLVASSTNRGVAANCNNGLRNSSGDWIKFIAGDDILCPGCVDDNLLFLSKNSSISVLFSKVLLFRFNNDVFEELGNFPKTDQIALFNIGASDQNKELLYNNFVWTAPSSFIKRELLDVVGGYDERFPFVEDYPMWLKLTRLGIPLFYFDKVTVLYRQENSLTRTESSWINSLYFKSLRSFYFVEIKEDLSKIDPSFCKRKNLYFYRNSLLISLFRNKVSLLSRVFCRIFDYVFKPAL